MPKCWFAKPNAARAWLYDIAHRLVEFPDIGSPAPVVGVRTYPVPKTGHSFDYRVVKGEIRIQRWYRQRQQPFGEL